MLQENSIEPSRADLRRFMAKVEINPNTACWEWTGAGHWFGYGDFSIRGRTIRAHRAMFSWIYGKIAPEAFICHRCDNAKCVNPLHLFHGSNSDNQKDALSKGRLGNSFVGANAAKSKCLRGHAFNYVSPKGRRGCSTCQRIRRHQRKAMTTPLEVREG